MLIKQIIEDNAMTGTIETDIPLFTIEKEEKGEASAIRSLRETFHSFFFKKNDIRIASIQENLQLFSSNQLYNDLSSKINEVFNVHASDQLKYHFNLVSNEKDKYTKIGHILLAKLNPKLFGLPEDSVNENLLNDNNVNAILNIFTSDSVSDQMLISLCMSAALAERMMTTSKQSNISPDILIAQYFTALELMNLQRVTYQIATDNNRSRAFVPLMALSGMLTVALLFAIPSFGASLILVLGYVAIVSLAAVIATALIDKAINNKKYNIAKDYFAETKNKILEEKFSEVAESTDQNLSSRICDANDTNDVVDALAENCKSSVAKLVL